MSWIFTSSSVSAAENSDLWVPRRQRRPKLQDSSVSARYADAEEAPLLGDGQSRDPATILPVAYKTGHNAEGSNSRLRRAGSAGTCFQLGELGRLEDFKVLVDLLGMAS